MSDPLGALTDDYPQANPSAIDAEDRRERERLALLRDKHGRPFDPALHASDGYGKPIVGARGHLLVRTSGSAHRARAQARSPSTLPPTGTGQGTVRLPPSPEALGAAIATIDFATQTAAGLWGEKWRPKTDAEREALIDAWARWYQARGVRDIPPGMLVLLVTGGYVSARLDEPARERIAGKLGRYGRWIKSKLGGRSARADTRADGNGEDAARSEPGGEVPSTAPQGPRNAPWTL